MLSYNMLGMDPMSKRTRDCDFLLKGEARTSAGNVGENSATMLIMIVVDGGYVETVVHAEI